MKPKRREWPEESELVVCTVTKVFPHGAFVKLEEFDREGMIHISEISSKWIKNIREYVQEGKRVVAKVLKMDQSKGHIDLSMKGLSEKLTRDRLKEWKNEGRADKLLQLAAKKEKKELEELYKGVGFPLEDEFGTVFAGLEAVSKEGKEALTAAGVGKEWFKTIEKITKDNIESSQVDITGFVELTSTNGEGIEDIKTALKEAEKVGEVNIQYVGAPKYRIKVVADDYKQAEKLLKNSAETAIKSIKKSGGKGEFYRNEKVKKV